MEAGLGDNVHLNGGVAARVVHGTGVNLGDRHVDGQTNGWREVRRGEKNEGMEGV